jgi:bacteriorhodopsin
VAVFLSLVASVMILMDCNTRQGNIKHAPKIRPIDLIFMINVPCIAFFTLGLSVSLTTNLANREHISQCTSDQLVDAWYKGWLSEGPNNGSHNI